MVCRWFVGGFAGGFVGGFVGGFMRFISFQKNVLHLSGLWGKLPTYQERLERRLVQPRRGEHLVPTHIGDGPRRPGDDRSLQSAQSGPHGSLHVVGSSL